MIMKKLLFLLTLLSGITSAIDIHEFETEQQRLDYQQLTEELRCLVCQNQNISGSDAGLAKDLRNEVAKLVRQGQSQTQITDYMVQRYGDFVRYSPPIRIDTIILWVLPFMVLIIAAIILIISIRKNKTNNTDKNTGATDS
ncbi:Cytochrome c heme lyase subunit CcmL [hydrothermal vent metagenome]|uniref:Cytochrome c heme lyase subunit CcmL n=1 Tax=hydrothermal vent metagenome TaxID=652676 RepID=A0A3B0UY25_9ZZZZ